eukprot:768615-Rhodomonas_salina.3
MGRWAMRERKREEQEQGEGEGAYGMRKAPSRVLSLVWTVSVRIDVRISARAQSSSTDASERRRRVERSMSKRAKHRGAEGRRNARGGNGPGSESERRISLREIMLPSAAKDDRSSTW